MSDIKNLEYTMLKVPYETLNRKFRACQKTIEREVSQINSYLTALDRCSDDSQIPLFLSSLEQSLSSLGRKVRDSVAPEDDTLQIIKTRVAHLKSGVTESILCSSLPEQSPDYTDWKETRLNRLIAEYLLTKGMHQTAQLMIDTNDLKELTNSDIFTTARNVESSLLSQDLKPCLSWCAENRSKLRKIRSTLEFNLHKQAFIELLKRDEKLKGIEYVKQYIPPCITEQFQYRELEESLGMLAYCSQNFEYSPYKKLVQPERWSDLSEQFRADNYKVHCLSSTPMLTQILTTGLCAIKTSECYKSDRKSSECPACEKNLNEIARELPSANITQSKVICSISRQPMNEHNPPLMLPNGYAYSYDALRAMSLNNNGLVTCPNTNRQFSWTDCKKVFLL